MLKTITLENYGEFTYDIGVYLKYMECSQKELVALFLSEELNSRYEFPMYKVTKMRKLVLATYLANWWRVCYNTEKWARKIPVYSVCHCGASVEVLENGTFKRHQWRGRCHQSGKFPWFVAQMRRETNLRDQQAGRTETYANVQVLDIVKGSRFGSRRLRRIGTKNAHRAHYGRRYQIS